MTRTTLPTIAALCAVLLPAGLAAANARHPAGARAVPATSGAPTLHRVDARGCDVLILWNTYRGEIDVDRAYVRVRGALTWTNIREAGLARVTGSISPPPLLKTNGRIWNWKEDLVQQRCDRDRRYRFRVVAPPRTAEPVVSNEPYAGTERWIYFPSSTGWTQKTTIDLGYLDACVMDGTKCSKPYYPSGPTPMLKW